jgi:hypothetical protein
VAMETNWRGKVAGSNGVSNRCWDKGEKVLVERVFGVLRAGAENIAGRAA